MVKQQLKTKDRKKIIRVLKTKVKFLEKLNRRYYEKFIAAEDEKAKVMAFVHSYGSYITRNGTNEQEKEFERLFNLFVLGDRRHGKK